MNAIAEQTKAWLQGVYAHDYAEKAHILRAAMAKGYGLDPTMLVRPFPGSQVNVTVNETAAPAAPPPKTWRWLPLAATLGATLLSGGGIGAGALVLGNYLWNRQPTQATPKLSETQEFEVRWQLGPDGKWQTVVERVKQ